MSFETILGFDVGSKRIGVAVGQTLTATASPVTILSAQNFKPDWQQVEALLAEWKPSAVVMGLPTHADESENRVATAVAKLARRLEQEFKLPVHFVDELLSSVEAQEQIDKSRPRRSRSKKRNQPIDDVAAQVILQSWFNEHSSNA